MFRVGVLLCAVILTQAVTVRTLSEHPAPRATCPDGTPDGGSYDSCAFWEEAVVAQRVALPQPPSPCLHSWHGPALAVVPSPAPDEIPHVPKPFLA